MRRIAQVAVAATIVIAGIAIPPGGNGGPAKLLESLDCVVAPGHSVKADVVSFENGERTPATLPAGYPLDVVVWSDAVFVLTPSANRVEGVSRNHLHCEPSRHGDGEERRIVKLCGGPLWGTPPATFAVRSIPAGSIVHVAVTSLSVDVSLVPACASLAAALRGDRAVSLVTTPHALTRAERHTGACAR